ncbi:MAG: SAM-dependent chlorinase/fluorinase [Cyanobacteria bacterium P01_D01_bin.128]
MAATITLLTDFGYQDAYVGIVKGVIAAIAPTATVIDLTHGISPQDCWAARFNLLNAYPYFDADTIHVAVVDPGVGAARRGIAIKTDHGTFIGPDNGIFSGVLSQARPQKAVTLTNAKFWRSPTPSYTFHGRDIFAPAAAHLTSGVSLESLGQAIAPESLTQLTLPAVRETASGLVGVVQHCDRFGNVITTISKNRLLAQGRLPQEWSLMINRVTIPSVKTYSDCPPGTLVALVGSHGWVEIAVNGGSAAQTLQPQVGATPVYLQQQRAT